MASLIGPGLAVLGFAALFYAITGWCLVVSDLGPLNEDIDRHGIRLATGRARQIVGITWLLWWRIVTWPRWYR